MLTVAPDTGFKRIEEVNKQEGKYFKKQRHIGRFDFYMIGIFFKKKFAKKYRFY